MRRHIVAMYFVWMLLVAPVLGQVVRVTSTSEGREVCRIVNGQQQCGTVRTVEYGTGVIVGRDQRYDYILTAKHVIDFDQNAVHGRPAELVAKHPTEDLAILRTPATTYDVATMGDDPRDGLAVYLDGLGDSGKADAKDYRQARGQVIGLTTVSHPSRDGDSGGAIAVGSQLYGIITHTSGTQTKFVPVSICRPFCVRWGACEPPPGSRVAPLPVPPPPRDIPDREKTSRIQKLEQAVADLQKRLTSVSQNPSSSKPVEILLVSYSKKDGREIVHGTVIVDTAAGGQVKLKLPDTTVQWLNHKTGEVESQGAFSAGTPVKLVVTPKMLGSKEGE